jgi:hypothetical protein
MNETPDLMWLAVTTLGVLALGGMLFYAMISSRAEQPPLAPNRRTTAPIAAATDLRAVKPVTQSCSPPHRRMPRVHQR